MDNKFKKLDGKHKLAVVMALVTWGISMYFSKQGFAVDNSKAQWLGWILATIVTTMELIFNSRTQKLSLTLISVGLICYAYGVWTNIIGFWAYQHPNEIMDWLSAKSVMSVFVGSILEVLPEPLFMFGIGAELEGDLLGNLAGLWSGNLDYAKPGAEQPKPNTVSTQPYKPTQNNYDPNKVQPINPNWTHNSKKNKGDPRKVVSNMFLDSYTNKYKEKK